MLVFISGALVLNKSQKGCKEEVRNTPGLNVQRNISILIDPSKIDFEETQEEKRLRRLCDRGLHTLRSDHSHMQWRPV